MFLLHLHMYSVVLRSLPSTFYTSVTSLLEDIESMQSNRCWPPVLWYPVSRLAWICIINVDRDVCVCVHDIWLHYNSSRYTLGFISNEGLYSRVKILFEICRINNRIPHQQ